MGKERSGLKNMELKKSETRKSQIRDLQYLIMETIGTFSKTILYSNDYKIVFSPFINVIHEYDPRKRWDVQTFNSSYSLYPNIDYEWTKEKVEKLYLKSIESYVIQDNIYIVEDSMPKDCVYSVLVDGEMLIQVGETEIKLSNEESATIRYRKDSAQVTIFNFVDFMSQLGEIYHDNQIIRYFKEVDNIE